MHRSSLAARPLEKGGTLFQMIDLTGIHHLLAAATSQQLKYFFSRKDAPASSLGRKVIQTENATRHSFERRFFEDLKPRPPL